MAVADQRRLSSVPTSDEACLANRKPSNFSGEEKYEGSDCIALMGKAKRVPTGRVRPSEKVKGLCTTVREHVTVEKFSHRDHKWKVLEYLLAPVGKTRFTSRMKLSCKCKFASIFSVHPCAATATSASAFMGSIYSG